ncbi:MAG: phasin family protein [Pseudazoarcus pumilus]|nr:phasin family protein [Pseudazoarcus pumilus]
MFATPEQIAAANKANLEAFVSIANSAFANAEKLAALNLSAARAVVEDGISNARSLMGVKDVQELFTLQGTLGKPLVEKAVSYNRSLYELATSNQEQMTKLFDKQVGELNKAFTGLIDKAAESAPAGSDVAFAAMKSAMAAANSAYDSVNKVAKQVAELAEANVSAATDATVKAVGAASKAPASKKAAA